MRNVLLGAILLSGACGGGGSGTTTPVLTSSQVVNSFFKAAADSNLNRMAELWGTSRGPFSETRPTDYLKRVAVLQVWVRADSARILSEDPVPGDDKHRRLAVAIYRSGCLKQVPVKTVRTGGGWVVENVEVAAAGNPARPCEPATP